MISQVQHSPIPLPQWLAIFAFCTSVAFSGDYARGQQVLSADLGKGVNFGNMLEAPFEGAWGLTVQPDFFDRVAERGFDHIRLPVSWTHHASTEAPYTVDPVFFARIDEVLAMAEAINVKVILNDHHHDELDADPVGESARFLAIWDQIATRYADRGDWLHFEILNEPHGEFSKTPALWNALLVDALNVIRSTNPTRKVVIGPVNFNSLHSLAKLQVPNDPNLIASIHYYDPFPFTHQGAPWINPAPPLGTTWRPFADQLAPPWQNYSWGTKVDNTGSGLKVTYQEGWAGFNIHRDSPIVDPQAIQFRVNRPFRLQVMIFDGDNTILYPVQSTATPKAPEIHVVEFDNLPPGFELRDIAIQNFSPESQIPMIISLLRFKQNDAWDFAMTTQTNVIRRDFLMARDWAIENKIPLHLGEFGAYREADLTNRENWNRSVRHTANVLGIDWAYWEFAFVDFGFYDPVNQEWRTSLLRSLLPTGFNN
jgi:aryl-phospho-beta-D-glucosidase BglC (GH1 family)